MFTQLNESRWGTTDIEPEQVIAYEAAYIRKFSADSYLQTNLFYLQNKNQIINIDPTFKNEGDTDIYGLEVEYKGSLSSSDRFYINYSYVDGEDQNGSELTNVAQHMVKTYYIYDVSESFSLSGVARYVGEKQRADTDTRDKLDGYTKVDLAVRYYDQKHDYTLTGSVNNVFNEDIRYPSPVPPGSYIEDYRQEDRNFLITLKKEF